MPRSRSDHRRPRSSPRRKPRVCRQDVESIEPSALSFGEDALDVTGESPLTIFIEMRASGGVWRRCGCSSRRTA